MNAVVKIVGQGSTDAVCGEGQSYQKGNAQPGFFEGCNYQGICKGISRYLPIKKVDAKKNSFCESSHSGWPGGSLTIL